MTQTPHSFAPAGLPVPHFFCPPRFFFSSLLSPAVLSVIQTFWAFAWTLSDVTATDHSSVTNTSISDISINGTNNNTNSNGYIVYATATTTRGDLNVSNLFVNAHDQHRHHHHHNQDQQQQEFSHISKEVREIFDMDYDEVFNISGEDWRNFSCHSMELESHFIKSVVEPIICLCGILGILLTMVVLSRKTMVTSTNCYLTALAVGDLLFLLTLGTRMLVDKLGDCQFHVSSERTIFLVYSIIFMDMFQYLTVGVTVMLAVERYIAICHPMRAMAVCTVTRARIFICVLALVSFILRSPKFLDIQISYTLLDTGDRILTVTWVYLYDEQAYTYVVTGVLLTALPLLTLLVLNVRLILEIRRSSRYLQLHLGLDSRQRSLVSSEQIKITMMLVAVIVAFFVCNAPYMMYSLFMAVSNFDPLNNTRLTNSSTLKVFKFACHSLLAVKSSCNFVLYCWFSEKFCQTFKRIFCIHNCLPFKSSASVAAAGHHGCYHGKGCGNNRGHRCARRNGDNQFHRPSCYITKETTC